MPKCGASLTKLIDDAILFLGLFFFFRFFFFYLMHAISSFLVNLCFTFFGVIKITNYSCYGNSCDGAISDAGYANFRANT